MESRLSTGIPSIDRLITAVLPGDNIVWQVDDLEDYRHLAGAFAQEALRSGKTLIYFRFGRHDPVLDEDSGVRVVRIDPSVGFDPFAQEVHNRISEFGRGVFYIFDCLSELVVDWQTDDSLANLFRVACPYLYELDTVTYFALKRGHHLDRTIARVRDTTQVLVDVFHHNGQTLLHPLKALDRYSPTMFLPHVYCNGECIPVFESGEAAELLSALRSHPLQSATSHSAAPWDRLFARVLELREAGADLSDMSTLEHRALRDDLLRMTLGSRTEVLRLAEHYLDLEDLLAIRDRLIGTGRIGGKAAGMILARKILRTPEPDDTIDFAARLEPHDSFYIGSDVFFGYLVDNNLFKVRVQQGRDIGAITREFSSIREQFLRGRFSDDILQQFSRLLDYFGQAPVIVRSSSLLEDDFGNAFAGKYDSIFCPNQGHLPDRLEAFSQAIKEVYASALSPDALAYRRKHNLADSDEQMAILVQRVAGSTVGRYYLPLAAGVGFSTSPYVWNESLDPKQGLLRLVVGLGTRAVERVGSDYPRTVFLSHPDKRPEAGAQQILEYSQRHVDAIDMARNEFVTIGLEELLQEKDGGAHFGLLFSVLEDGYLSDPISRTAFRGSGKPVVTLNNLLMKTDFPALMRGMLRKLEAAYGRPVDTEFTVGVRDDGSVRVNLLQCRTLALPGVDGEVELPQDLPRDQVLFQSTRCAGGGIRRGITHIVYIDPIWYDRLPLELKRRLGRTVGRLNNHPELRDGGLMMMGPGRWGSNNIDLGVNVTYSDINNAAVLVEIARETGGHTPEVSYGTHFFQDLVEDGILYVPVYPDREETGFDEDFFVGQPNAVERYLDNLGELSGAIHLIDLKQSGRSASVMISPSERRAVCFLEEG